MTMKIISSCTATVSFLAFFLLLLSSTGRSLQLPPAPDTMGAEGNHGEDANNVATKKAETREELSMELSATGSSLPDCSHACGPCYPCRRVMVSFKCSIAESCPIVYRCMCKGKYYPVPSN